MEYWFFKIKVTWTNNWCKKHTLTLSPSLWKHLQYQGYPLHTKKWTDILITSNKETQGLTGYINKVVIFFFTNPKLCLDYSLTKHSKFKFICPVNSSQMYWSFVYNILNLSTLVTSWVLLLWDCHRYKLMFFLLFICLV